MPTTEVRPENTFTICYEVWVHLADNEWGLEIMDRLAREYIDKHVSQVKAGETICVTIHEHGGWWLSYTMIGGKMITVGSANDRAIYKDSVREWRERSYYSHRQLLESIRR